MWSAASCSCHWNFPAMMDCTHKLCSKTSLSFLLLLLFTANVRTPWQNGAIQLTLYSTFWNYSAQHSPWHINVWHVNSFISFTHTHTKMNALHWSKQREKHIHFLRECTLNSWMEKHSSWSKPWLLQVYTRDEQHQNHPEACQKSQPQTPESYRINLCLYFYYSVWNGTHT